jgi:hypothetical protein
MAQTTGLVQRLNVAPTAATACAWIGPSPTNAELLYVLRESNQAPNEGAFENSMVDALTAAMVHRREVTAYHGDTDARISSLEVKTV